MMLPLYRMTTTLGGPLIRAYLSLRLRRGKEDPERFGERLGKPSLKRPDGPLIWVHAASVGECLSILPLIERVMVLEPKPSVLVTSGTVTSARLMKERLPIGAFHQFIPVDRIPFVRRFLDHWRPDAVLWAESEFWPNLVIETSAKGVPIILINGRISDRSFARWRRYPKTIARILDGFALCMGQTETDAERLRILGAEAATCPGNLKYAAPPLPVDPKKLQDLTSVMAGRRVWLAASTHAGEEEICGNIHRNLSTALPEVLTVIVPRHPQRGREIADTLAQRGLSVSLRSADQAIDGETDVYVADTIGELGLFYRLAEVSFIGKSLVPLGGQNPFEAACLGCPTLFGPHMTNFRDMARRMVDAGAAIETSDSEQLRATLANLFAEEGMREAMSAAGIAYVEAEAGVLERVVERISPVLLPTIRTGGGNAAA